jgi:hypothetical protein
MCQQFSMEILVGQQIEGSGPSPLEQALTHPPAGYRHHPIRFNGRVGHERS